MERCPRPTLSRHVALVWAERSAVAEPLLPDAAVELVWSGRGLFVRGADTRAHCTDVFPDRTFVAVRFHPGSAARVLGLYGRDLADARVGVSALWGRAEMERLADRVGISERQLLRRCVEALGYGPKTLDRILRFQRFLTSARRESDLARLATEAGYADQAHLTRECVRLSGLTPARLLCRRHVRFVQDTGAAASVAWAS